MASVYYLVENFWLILLSGSGSSAWCATLYSLLPPESLIPHNKQGQQGAGFWYTWRPLVLHYVLSSAFPDYSSIRCNTFRPYIGLCKYSCVFLLSYSLCSYPHVFFFIQSRYRQASAFPVFRGKCPAMALSCSLANVLSSAFYVSGYAAGASPAASPWTHFWIHYNKADRSRYFISKSRIFMRSHIRLCFTFRHLPLIIPSARLL